MYQTGDLHKAREEALKEFDQPKVCVKTADEHFSDRGHFNFTCFDLWSNYASTDGSFQLLIRPDGTPATEVTFSIPFYEDDTVIVNLCGTIDKIGKIKGGCNAIGDWKFTGFWDEKTFLRQFFMASQLRFYVLSLRLMGRLFPDSQLGMIGSGQLGAFIDGIFVKPKVAETTFRRSDVFIFKDDDMNMFEASLLKRIKQFSQAISDGTVLIKEGILLNTCQLKYHPCSFYVPCSAGNNAIEQLVLEQNFIRREYDPINRDKI